MNITINKKNNIDKVTRPINLFGIDENCLYVMCDKYGMILDFVKTRRLI